MIRLYSSRPLPAVLMFVCFALAAGGFPSAARAENEGQADLDKATQQKLGAQSAEDLTDVIQLCESAVKKGLDKGNTAFANDLLAASLAQRGGMTAGKAYRAVLTAGADATTDVVWKAFRSDALADLEKAVKLNPKQPQAQLEIAKLQQLPGGDKTKAIAALDQTIALSTDDAALRAEAFVERSALRSDPQKRLSDLDEAVRALPGNAVVLRRRGLLLAEAEKWDAALADFSKAIELEPKQVSTYQLKAQVLLKTKKLKEALAVLEQGHKVLPDNIELLVGKGQILVAEKDYKAAAEELSRALAINPSSLPILELRAALYEELGQKDKALADIDKVLEIKPEQPNLLRMRAVLLAELGKYSEAVGVLEGLHKANPKDSTTLLQMGMLYTSMKKFDKAVDIYGQMLSEHPDDADAIRGRGDALLNMGHRAGARADYERALKIQPHDVGLLNNFAWLLATAPETELRDGHRALALATDACRQTEYKADYILSTLAAAYAETGDFESARKWAAQAVEVKPSPNAEPTRKDELRKELESYKASKPWREDLPLPEDKASAGGKKGDAASKDAKKSDTPKKKKKKKKKPAPPPEDKSDDPPSK